MSLKEVLVHLNQSRGSDSRLRLAIELAKRHSSHLSALFVDEWNSEQLETRATAELALAAAPDLALLDRSVAREIETAASRLRASLEAFKAIRGGIEADWRQSSGFSDVLLKQEAPYTDITIIGHGSGLHRTSESRSFCEKLLCETGGPLLLIPDDVHTDSDGVGRRIVVAWDASAPATHALNFALPLIEKSERTTIINIGFGAVRLTLMELGRLVERLHRHGASANVVQLESPSDRIAELLQSQAADLGADLIVCGAFGHNRLKEHVLGGVTCDLLRRPRLSLFIAR